MNTGLRGFFYRFWPTRQSRPGIGYETAVAQFQAYPDNNVQGGGVLSQRFTQRVTQPPQVVQVSVPILGDLDGGGVTAGQLFNQPLINNQGQNVMG